MMWDIKNYRFRFDPRGLALFLLVMLPNLVWSAVPAPHDILRRESVTPLLDSIAQVFQITMTAALCAVINATRDRPMKRRDWAGIAACVLLYFAGWIAYYAGIANPAVILTLCLAPCGAFLLLAQARKNAPALLAAGGFTVCHFLFAVINFILKNPGAA